ncbi:glyceraldehyde-3-phosphate dehydrogenase [Myxococcota bacterium]|nr:glyceraldehyde-3-phosphate dehydrogenase [Myxococcota bacterium]MBU1538138.1 glyceraldehyde-3-phosphate dehydrogenase [Myxococcota bacterium]
MRVLGINGLGRIGKLTLWRHVALSHFDKIVVNTGREVGKSLEDLASYLESDSTYGQLSRYLYGFKGDAMRPVVKVKNSEEGILEINGKEVWVLRKARNPREISWHEHQVGVVVDTTGVFTDPTREPGDPRGALRGHLEGGARKVINSSAFKMKAPAQPDDAITMIWGINHMAYDTHQHHVISAASCTTTALAHMVKPLLEDARTRKILTASMSTIHSATNTQSVLDKVPDRDAKDLRKNRMVLDNIILTSTNAASALGIVIPEIQEIGFLADSVRIPTSTVSLVTLNLTIQSQIDEGGESSVTREVVNGVLQSASTGSQKGSLVFSEEQKVSSDYKGVDAAVVIEAHDTHTRTAFLTLDPKALGLDLPQTPILKIPVTHAKIFGWYDNELGSYTNRLADLTIYVDEQLD